MWEEIPWIRQRKNSRAIFDERKEFVRRLVAVYRDLGSPLVEA